MIREKIETWLATPDDYQAGLSLLTEVTGNARFAKTMARQTNSRLEKIKYELKKAARKLPTAKACPKPKVLSQPKSSSTHATPEVEAINYRALPDHLKTVYIKTIEAVRGIAKLHDGLRDKTPDERTPAIKKMRELFFVRDTGFEQLELWQKQRAV